MAGAHDVFSVWKGDGAVDRRGSGKTAVGGRRRDIDLGLYERLLREKQSSLGKGFESLRDHTFAFSLKESTGEDSSYDQHSADLALPTFERAKDLGLKDGLEIGLNRIGLALDRLRRGDYGYCLSCGEEIPEGRLAAMPEAELCVRCQEKQEVVPASRRPVEEYLPRRPAGGIETLTDDVDATGKNRPVRDRWDIP